MRLWLALPILVTCACAQMFEVASLKLSGSGSDNRIEGGPGSPDPIRYRYTGATLEDLIVTAYDVEYFQVVSKQPIDRDNFDVMAIVPPGATKQEFRIMLQNLLRERFSLKLHTTKRTFAGYALVVANARLLDEKAGRTAPPSSASGFPEMASETPGIRTIETIQDGHVLVRLRAQKMSISEVARSIHVPGDGPVVDQTGRRGKYDFMLEYAYPLHDSSDIRSLPPAPAIFGALQTQLGLRLVSRRVPLDVLVIDSFNRMPAEN